MSCRAVKNRGQKTCSLYSKKNLNTSSGGNLSYTVEHPEHLGNVFVVKVRRSTRCSATPTWIRRRASSSSRIKDDSSILRSLSRRGELRKVCDTVVCMAWNLIIINNGKEYRCNEEV